MPQTPLSRGSALPVVKGAEKGIGIFITQQKRGFTQFHRVLSEVLVREFAPRVFDDFLKIHTRVCKAALKRTGTQVQVLRNLL